MFIIDNIELKRIREQLGLSKPQMAERLSISLNYLYQLEKGPRSVPQKIADAVDEMLKNDQIYPAGWMSGFIFDQKPSQEISKGISLSTHIEFHIVVEKSVYQPVSADENGYFSVIGLDRSEEQAVFTPSMSFSKYDKHRINDNKFCFFLPEDACGFIMEHSLVICDFVIEDNVITILTKPIEISFTELFQEKFRIVLRKLDASEGIKAATLVSSRYDSWRKKTTWKKSLPLMTRNGIERGIFCGYAYFLEIPGESRCISYIDTKLRSDGLIEVGVVVTATQFLGCGLGHSLLFLMRLKHYSSGIWVGTAQENIAMLRTLKKQGEGVFKPYLFEDEYGREGHRVLERLSRDEEGKERLSASVYLKAPSLSDMVFVKLKKGNY